MGLLALTIALGESLIYAIQSLIVIPNFDLYFKIISAIISLMCITIFICEVIKLKFIYKSNIFIIYSLVFVLILYYSTKIKYGYRVDNYETQLLMYGVHVIPATLMGCTLAFSKRINEMLKWLQPIMIIYTFNITISVVSSDITNSTIGVQALNENTLNYQTISYYITLAFAINLFIIKYFKDMDHFKIFSNEIWKNINYLLAIVQIFCLITAGGRGGTVLFIVIVVYNIIISFKDSLKSYKIIFKNVLFSIAGISSIAFISNIPYVKIGLNRVLEFFTGGQSRILNDYRITYHLTEAIKSFMEKPILGHGMGSIFYEFGIYTHNVFTDILVEGGLVYLIIFSTLLLVFIYKIIKIIKLDYRVNIIFIIFIYSFITLMFSGYYLNQTAIWFAMGFIFTYNTEHMLK